MDTTGSFTGVKQGTDHPPLLVPCCIRVVAVPTPPFCAWGNLLFNSEPQYGNINKTEFSLYNLLAIRVHCLDDFLIM